MSILYAWVVPAYADGSPVDHTWVTTYDSRVHAYPDIAAVKAAGERNWYCWGSFHPKGGAPGHADGYIGSQSGDLNLADCLVAPNLSSSGNPPAQGTIFTYGVDGVCHQLANQVLYSTGGSGSSPLTVKRARGYALSSFIYGTYGLQHTAWQKKIAACTGTRLPLNVTDGAGPMADLPDDFEQLAREALGDRTETLSKLLSLRAQVQAFAMQTMPGFLPPDPDYLNARNQQLIDQAAALLGPDDFRKLFGIAPGEKVNLVDPKIER
ncbi:MAG: hypothetical protein O9309_02305 [Rhizobium sp.]|nr:hypothetical protein [Rhizobium sp.]MCZ8349408.1 hypothetical protein [Rhizobium sp.]